MDSAAWGVIGTAVGAAASIGTTWLSNRNAASLQTAARADERIEAHREFQRQTLIELQDVFHDAIRLVSRVHIEDCNAEQNGSSWGQNYLPDELSESMRLANRRVMLLVERVSDDALRQTTKSVMALAYTVTKCSSRAEASACLDDVTIQSVAAIEKSGSILRGLYVSKSAR